MSQSSARAAMLERIREAAARDPRIVGLLDYGSGSEGRLDEWSDLDLEVFIRDADLEDFARNWKAWAAQLGALLLAYVGHIGHPWTVYDTEPLPLRVDFDLHPASAIEQITSWANTPVSVEAMVLYDGTDGKLTEAVRRLIGRSRRPEDPRAEFERVCGDFWYFLLYVYNKLQRGEGWVARQVFHTEVVEQLIRLLRLEAGALERWRWSPAAADIERTLSPERLAALDACMPGPGTAELARALGAAAALGRQACARTGSREGWPWPDALVVRVTQLLGAPPG